MKKVFAIEVVSDKMSETDGVPGNDNRDKYRKFG
tara:strand:+ start:687 stop:788 length:102 start_codon:yes stop_codon:yes gene_type:complete